MMHHAKGTFDVKVLPQPADDPAAGPFSRLFLDKQFKGDLDAASKGQMVAAGTAVRGSAAYGASVIKQAVRPSRHVHSQHNGTMRNGGASMQVTVVPDSGTGDLVGLSGKMTIIIEGKPAFLRSGILSGPDAAIEPRVFS